MPGHIPTPYRGIEWMSPLIQTPGATVKNDDTLDPGPWGVSQSACPNNNTVHPRQGQRQMQIHIQNANPYPYPNPNSISRKAAIHSIGDVDVDVDVDMDLVFLYFCSFTS